MKNRIAKLEVAIDAAKSALENMPMGAIGDGGPTLAELDAVSGAGRVWEDDACYHDAQRAWRILDDAIKGEETKEANNGN